MRDVIASVAVALLLAWGWATYVVVTSHGGVFRVLEGAVFLGIPGAAAAGAIALLAPMLVGRMGWSRLPAYLFLGMLSGVLIGIANAAGLSNDQSLNIALVAQQLGVFALLGAALGALVIGVSRSVRVRNNGA
jgi:hypothetical protein